MKSFIASFCLVLSAVPLIHTARLVNSPSALEASSPSLALKILKRQFNDCSIGQLACSNGCCDLIAGCCGQWCCDTASLELCIGQDASGQPCCVASDATDMSCSFDADTIYDYLEDEDGGEEESPCLTGSLVACANFPGEYCCEGDSCYYDYTLAEVRCQVNGTPGTSSEEFTSTSTTTTSRSTTTRTPTTTTQETESNPTTTSVSVPQVTQVGGSEGQVAGHWSKLLIALVIAI